ncbi:MAG: hypothetical protein AB7G35_16260 [Hyphomicrobiaceae bacterium]
MNFLVELVWSGEKDGETASVYLTPDRRVLLQGRPVPDEERARLGLPDGAGLISVDRALIQAIKEML